MAEHPYHISRTPLSYKQNTPIIKSDLNILTRSSQPPPPLRASLKGHTSSSIIEWTDSDINQRNSLFTWSIKRMGLICNSDFFLPWPVLQGRRAVIHMQWVVWGCLKIGEVLLTKLRSGWCQIVYICSVQSICRWIYQYKVQCPCVCLGPSVNNMVPAIHDGHF